MDLSHVIALKWWGIQAHPNFISVPFQQQKNLIASFQSSSTLSKQYPFLHPKRTPIVFRMARCPGEIRRLYFPLSLAVRRGQMTRSGWGDVNRNLVDETSMKVNVFLLKRDRFGLGSFLPLRFVLHLACNAGTESWTQQLFCELKGKRPKGRMLVQKPEGVCMTDGLTELFHRPWDVCYMTKLFPSPFYLASWYMQWEPNSTWLNHSPLFGG